MPAGRERLPSCRLGTHAEPFRLGAQAAPARVGDTFGERCVVTTQSPETGLKDFDTLKTIASYRQRMTDQTGLPFGMYAEVEHPGRVRVGDGVEVQG